MSTILGKSSSRKKRENSKGPVNTCWTEQIQAAVQMRFEKPRTLLELDKQ